MLYKQFTSDDFLIESIASSSSSFVTGEIRRRELFGDIPEFETMFDTTKWNSIKVISSNQMKMKFI